MYSKRTWAVHFVTFEASHFKELVSAFNLLPNLQYSEVRRFQDSIEVSLDFPGTLFFQRFIVSRINSN